jgi:hypothetical protein
LEERERRRRWKRLGTVSYALIETSVVWSIKTRCGEKARTNVREKRLNKVKRKGCGRDEQGVRAECPHLHARGREVKMDEELGVCSVMGFQR